MDCKLGSVDSESGKYTLVSVKLTAL